MIPEIKYIDFPKICRLCLNEGDFINILDRPDLIYVYFTITNNTIKRIDCFPKNICLECVNKLEALKDFIQLCKHSYDYLTAVILHQDDKHIIHEEIVKQNGNISFNNVFENGENTENDDDNASLYQEDNKLMILEDSKLGIKIKSEIQKNIKINTIDINKECKKCKKIFRSNNLFKIHMNNHNKKRKKYRSNVKIESSVETIEYLVKSNNFKKIVGNEFKFKSSKKKWGCFECNKEFSKKNDLQRHLRIHTGSRPFVCAVCDLKFTQKSTLNRHINAIHILDQKEKYHFECYICDKKFNRKDHLEAHMINCHIKKINENCIENPDQKICTECGKSFSLFSYTKHHNIVHMKEGKVSKVKKVRSNSPSCSFNLCSVCGKTFEKRATYSQHMRRSHGSPSAKKPNQEKCEKKHGETQSQKYQCWKCGKIKSTLFNLKVHMRIHTGEKPYECKFCYKKFSAWNSWHDHENIHLGLKPYQCDHCKKVFRQRSSLRKHLRSSVHVNQNKIITEDKSFV